MKQTNPSNPTLQMQVITEGEAVMKKNQVHARLIEQGSNFEQWALANGYKPRTVTQAVTRWAGKKHLPQGRLTFRILQELSRDIGQEILPGLLKEVA